MPEALVVVLDVGKTLAKLSLWRPSGEMVARATRPNVRSDAGGYVGLDVAGIEPWIAETLRSFTAHGRIGAIVPVGHGAAAAIVRDGALVCTPMDYEEPLPAEAAAQYERQRDSFALTGSPRLPDGLNLGAQFHYLESLVPNLFSGDAKILLWPQFWAWRLSGVAASEVTSLGCHSDLWFPRAGQPSRMAASRGWARCLPPLRRAADSLGVLTPEWVEKTGLPADVRIYCGIHDSNAALLAARGFKDMAGRESTVLSTGTWFVAMRSPGSPDAAPVLPEGRDCLTNVDANGMIVPSSRFMGGREIEVLVGVDTRRIDIRPDQPGLIAALPQVIGNGALVLPTFAPGFGPFADQRGRWLNMPANDVERRAAVSLYAALMADAALDLIGAKENVLVEGRFAEAEVFVRALASLRRQDRVCTSNAHTDVSYGALRLINPDLAPPGDITAVEPFGFDLEEYRRAWRRDVFRNSAAA